MKTVITNAVVALLVLTCCSSASAQMMFLPRVCLDGAMYVGERGKCYDEGRTWYGTISDTKVASCMQRNWNLYGRSGIVDIDNVKTAVNQLGKNDNSIRSLLYAVEYCKPRTDSQRPGGVIGWLEKAAETLRNFNFFNCIRDQIEETLACRPATVAPPRTTAGARSQTTQAPMTTAQPTTQAPMTTAQPTTQAPMTTAQPTTQAPMTTAQPTTQAPLTTAQPTTQQAPMTTAQATTQPPPRAQPTTQQVMPTTQPPPTTLAAAQPTTVPAPPPTTAAAPPVPQPTTQQPPIVVTWAAVTNPPTLTP